MLIDMLMKIVDAFQFLFISKSISTSFRVKLNNGQSLAVRIGFARRRWSNVVDMKIYISNPRKESCIVESALVPSVENDFETKRVLETIENLGRRYGITEFSLETMTEKGLRHIAEL